MVVLCFENCPRVLFRVPGDPRMWVWLCLVAYCSVQLGAAVLCLVQGSQYTIPTSYPFRGAWGPRILSGKAAHRASDAGSCLVRLS